MPKEKVEDSVDFRDLRIAIAHKFAYIKEVMLYLPITERNRLLMSCESDKGAGDTTFFTLMAFSKVVGSRHL